MIEVAGGEGNDDGDGDGGGDIFMVAELEFPGGWITHAESLNAKGSNKHSSADGKIRFIFLRPFRLCRSIR